MIHKILAKVFGHSIAHRATLWKLGAIESVFYRKRHFSLSRPGRSSSRECVDVMGIRFRHRVGLGAGIDHCGKYLNALFRYGVAFIESGPASLKDIREIIRNINTRKPAYPVAICIEKDHAAAFSLAYDFADFFVFDIPFDTLEDVLDSIISLRLTNDNYKPVVLKLSHDLSREDLSELVNSCIMSGVDALEVAGIDNVRKTADICKGHLPIIGYGGIRSNEDLLSMLDAGASLVNITTAIHLDGTSAIKNIIQK